MSIKSKIEKAMQEAHKKDTTVTNNLNKTPKTRKIHKSNEIYNLNNLNKLNKPNNDKIYEINNSEAEREKKVITNEDIDKITENTEYAFLLKEALRFMIGKHKVPTSKNMNCKFGYPNSASYYKYHDLTIKKGGHGVGVSGAISFLSSYCAMNPNKKLKMPPVCITKKSLPIERYHFFETIKCNLLDALICKTDGRTNCKFNNIISEDYGKIVFKFSSLNNSMWIFSLRTKIEDNQDIDNFICVGSSHNLTQIEYIWCIPNNKFDNIKNLSVYDTFGSLNRLSKYEITDLLNIDNLVL